MGAGRRGLGNRGKSLVSQCPGNKTAGFWIRLGCRRSRCHRVRLLRPVTLRPRLSTGLPWATYVQSRPNTSFGQSTAARPAELGPPRDSLGAAGRYLAIESVFQLAASSLQNQASAVTFKPPAGVYTFSRHSNRNTSLFVTHAVEAPGAVIHGRCAAQKTSLALALHSNDCHAFNGSDPNGIQRVKTRTVQARGKGRTPRPKPVWWAVRILLLRKQEGSLEPIHNANRIQVHSVFTGGIAVAEVAVLVPAQPGRPVI